MREKTILHGTVVIKHIRDGKVIDVRAGKNVVTNVGKAEIAGLICADQAASYTAFDYIAIGTGTTAASDTDTALEAEITSGGGERQNATGTIVTTDTTDDTAQFEATFNFTSSFAVTEAGLFNASTGGTMLCRKVFDVINVVSGDKLQVTWKIDVD